MRQGRTDVAATVDNLLTDGSLFGNRAATVSRARLRIRDADVELAPIRERLSKNPEQVLRNMSQEEVVRELAGVQRVREIADELVSVGAGKYAKSMVREADRIEKAIASRAKAYGKASDKLKKAQEAAATPRERIVDQVAEELIFSNTIMDNIPATGIGAIVGGGPGAIAANLLQYALKPSGILGRLGNMQKVFTKFERDMIKHNKKFTAALGRAGRTFRKIEDMPKPASAIVAALRSKDTRNEAIEDIRSQISEFTANPQVLTEELTLAAMPLSEIDETMGDMLQMRAVEGLLYLQAQFPEQQRNPLDPASPALPLSNSEADRFADVYEALEEPMSMYTNLIQGTLSQDAVEAVKTVYPEVYTEIGRNIAAVVANHYAQGEEIPYQMTTAMHMAFGIETDPTQSPDFIFNAQSIGVQTPEQAQVQGLTGPRRGTGVDFAQSTLTQSQRIEFE